MTQYVTTKEQLAQLLADGLNEIAWISADIVEVNGQMLRVIEPDADTWQKTAAVGVSTRQHDSDREVRCADCPRTVWVGAFLPASVTVYCARCAARHGGPPDDEGQDVTLVTRASHVAAAEASSGVALPRTANGDLDLGHGVTVKVLPEDWSPDADEDRPIYHVCGTDPQEGAEQVACVLCGAVVFAIDALVGQPICPRCMAQLAGIQVPAPHL